MNMNIRIINIMNINIMNINFMNSNILSMQYAHHEHGKEDVIHGRGHEHGHNTDTDIDKNIFINAKMPEWLTIPELAQYRNKAIQSNIFCSGTGQNA